VEDFLEDSQDLIIIASSVLTFIAVVILALPVVQKGERKQRYRAVIEQKRKALYQQARDEAKNRKPTQRQTAAQSISAMYMVQKLAGKTAIKARDLLLQAGYRNPKAPLVYLMIRMILPLVLAGFTAIILAASDKEIEDNIAFGSVLMAAFVGFMLPRVLVKNQAVKRQEEIQLAFPDALDMMLICVQGGLSVEASINKLSTSVADHSETLAEELGILCAELGLLNDRKAAFQDFSRRIGTPAARSFSTAMIQAEQYGTSVVKAMRVLSEDQRDQRMMEAERKAASLPPKLTVPMIVFFLPTLFIIILGPAALKAMNL